MAGLLVTTGAGMGLHSAGTVQTLVAGSGALEGPLWLALAAAAASLAIKEALFHATVKAGERASSKVRLATQQCRRA